MRDAFFSHLETLARCQPQQVTLADASSRITYGELPDVLNQRVTQLRRSGASRVGVMLDNGVAWALWDLALMQAGCVSVPLPAFFSPAQLTHVLARAGIDTLIGPTEFARAQGFDTAHDETLHRRADAPSPPLPDGTHKITFTSGTSGSPKGVCLGSDSQLTVARSLADVAADCGVRHHLALLPLATLLENVGGLYAPLWLGARVTLPALASLGWQGGAGFDADLGWRTLHEQAPDSLILVPQLLSALLTRQAGTPLDFGRFFAVGGAPVAPSLLARAAAAGWPIYEGYGLSECTSVVTLNRPGDTVPGSVGTPLPHARVTLTADGEVQVEGALMLGYLGDDTPMPSRWPTGDLGVLTGERLQLAGRRRQVFITAYGRNVDPAWVEAELTADPAIAQAWVSGEAEPANRALLVPRGDWVDDRQLAEAVAHANARLPDYARVSLWRRTAPFTPDNDLATANGRLRRDALAKRYAAWLQQPVTPATA
ncbi:AMP-binding protein [Salinicola avicenniae]|uniref:AMP-binding protein n=1 Tax=Salinicola avicenniae TaxID=2916836 RepID=UPI002073DEA5|nr:MULTISPECIES: AMP-binding protein [unclassified Salinicola]